MLGKLIISHKKALLFSAVTLAGLATAATFKLTTSDPVYKTIYIKHGNEFAITLLPVSDDTPSYIIPGEDIVSFDPYITNNGDSDIYTFIEIVLPDSDFKLENLSSDWTPVYEDDTKVVFVYGNPKQAYPVQKRHKSNGEFLYDSTTELTSVISVNEDTDLEGGPYNVDAIGYAVETGINEKNPTEIWNLVDTQISSR